MTRETKIGLVVAGSFLCLVCVVVASKMNGSGDSSEEQKQPPTGPTNAVAAASTMPAGKEKPHGEKQQPVVPAPTPTAPENRPAPGLSVNGPTTAKTPEQAQKDLEDLMHRQKKEQAALLPVLPPGAIPPPVPGPAFDTDIKLPPPPAQAQAGSPPTLPAPLEATQPKGPANQAAIPEPGPAPLVPLPGKDFPPPIVVQGGGPIPAKPVDPSPAPLPAPIGKDALGRNDSALIPAPGIPLGKDSFQTGKNPQPPGPSAFGPDKVDPPAPPNLVAPPSPAPLLPPPSIAPMPPPASLTPPIQGAGLPPASLPPQLPMSPPGPPFTNTPPAPNPIIGSAQLPSTPPIMVPGGAAPIATLPPAATATMPLVKSVEPDIVRLQPGEASFSQLSKRLYNDPKYADALQAFNRDHWRALADGQPLSANQPVLTSGQQVLHPPLGILERDYARLIASGAPPALVPVIGTTTTPRPTPVVPASAPITTTAAGRIYTVQTPGGERIRDIALQVFGDRDRWTDIYRANPTLQPQFAIPQGTQLKLP